MTDDETRQPQNVLFRWSKVDENREDEPATIELPASVGQGYPFEHEGQRWKIVAQGPAQSFGFERALVDSFAWICDPVFDEGQAVPTVDPKQLAAKLRKPLEYLRGK